MANINFSRLFGNEFFHGIPFYCYWLLLCPEAAGVANYRPIFRQRVTAKIGVEITNFSLIFHIFFIFILFGSERKKCVLYLELFNGVGDIHYFPSILNEN